MDSDRLHQATCGTCRSLVYRKPKTPRENDTGGENKNRASTKSVHPFFLVRFFHWYRRELWSPMWPFFPKAKPIVLIKEKNAIAANTFANFTAGEPSRRTRFVYVTMVTQSVEFKIQWPRKEELRKLFINDELVPWPLLRSVLDQTHTGTQLTWLVGCWDMLHVLLY